MRAGKRHVLVVSTVGGGAAREKALARHAVLGLVVGVVVVDFVVVPGHDPRAGAVRGLQIGIGLVQRIARAIVIERVRLPARVLAHMVAPPGRLVDVIAEKDDEIGRVGDDVAVGAVVALLVLLAGGEGEAQPRG